MRSNLTESINKFMAGVDDDWSDLEKLLYINYYIGRVCDFDMTHVRTHSADVYGVMVEHLAVCAGYTETFKMLAYKLGIECYHII